MDGKERNGDFVRMCSYAPLLENCNDRFWPVNLIWINSSQVMGRASYYVQKMFAENRPDYNLVCSAYENSVENPGYRSGKISLGTNHTVSEFKDENSFDEPTKIVPVESRWNGFGKNFTYELQPYSFTILRIKAGKRG